MIVLLLLWALLVPPGADAAELRFYGGVLLSRGIAEQAHREGTDSVNKGLLPFLADDAVHITNLEGAVGNKSRCIRKGSLCFSIGPRMPDILSGFDVVGLENNHSLDLGPAGREATISALEKRGIAALGGDRHSLVLETDRGNLGIVALTDAVNAKEDKQHLHMADDPQALQEIRRLKRRCTLTAVYVHWGRELDRLPTARMRAMAASFIEAGADMVVGTHPHVPGKVEIIRGKPVVYSLGNFLFDQKYEDTKQGAIFDCRIDEANRLCCRLSGVKTPANAFIPAPVSGDAYARENVVLGGCRPVLTPTWTGKYRKGKGLERLQLKTDPSDPSLSCLELSDPETGKCEMITPSMPVRKLQTIDVNGDGIDEIMLVLRVYSTLDREVAKRVYIYSMNPKFHALWRGSALSRPMEDVIFVKGKQKPLLAALHTTDSFLRRNPGKPGRIIMSYRWNGFGFSGVREFRTGLPADHLASRGDSVMVCDGQGRVQQRIPVKDLE